MTTLNYALCYVCPNKHFQGNATAVFLLEQWLSDEKLKELSTSVQVQEVTFSVYLQGRLEVRWFNQENEVPLCGHGSLALSHVLQIENDRAIDIDNLEGKLALAKKQLWFDLGHYQNTFVPYAAQSPLWMNERDVILPVANRQIVQEFDSKNIPDVKGRLTFIVTSQDEQNTVYFRLFVLVGHLHEDPVSISALPVLATLFQEYYGQTVNRFVQDFGSGIAMDVCYQDGKLGITGDVIVSGWHEAPL